MAERSNARVCKTRALTGYLGSNPSLGTRDNRNSTQGKIGKIQPHHPRYISSASSGYRLYSRSQTDGSA